MQNVLYTTLAQHINLVIKISHIFKNCLIFYCLFLHRVLKWSQMLIIYQTLHQNILSNLSPKYCWGYSINLTLTRCITTNLQSGTKVLRKLLKTGLLLLQIGCSCKIPSPLLSIQCWTKSSIHEQHCMGEGEWLTHCLPTFKLNISVLWIFSRGFVPDCSFIPFLLKNSLFVDLLA